MGCAEQPGVRALQWRASVFQLDDVIDEHASLSATTARRLASSACFASHSIAQRYPWWRRVEGTSKNGPVIDLLSMAPDVSWVRRGLVSAISGFLPPDAQVGA